ncbi:MAG: hypothetical protein IK045_02380 [Bacteroidales bacterium]|nr:hypothetical protein [Bacteroidales bacterium]
MEQKLYAKIFKWCSWALLVASVVILLVAWLGGFSDAGVNLLLGWAYGMLGLAIAAIICVGIFITATTHPKNLIKLCIVVAGVAVIALLCWVLAKGNPAVGYTGAVPPSQGTLKLTDAVLNLTYLVGGAAIVAIIFSEIYSAIRSKKA